VVNRGLQAIPDGFYIHFSIDEIIQVTDKNWSSVSTGHYRIPLQSLSSSEYEIELSFPGSNLGGLDNQPYRLWLRNRDSIFSHEAKIDSKLFQKDDDKDVDEDKDSDGNGTNLEVKTYSGASARKFYRGCLVFFMFMSCLFLIGYLAGKLWQFCKITEEEARKGKYQRAEIHEEGGKSTISHDLELEDLDTDFSSPSVSSTSSSSRRKIKVKSSKGHNGTIEMPNLRMKKVYNTVNSDKLTNTPLFAGTTPIQGKAGLTPRGEALEKVVETQEEYEGRIEDSIANDMSFAPTEREESKTEQSVESPRFIPNSSTQEKDHETGREQNPSLEKLRSTSSERVAGSDGDAGNSILPESDCEANTSHETESLLTEMTGMDEGDREDGISATEIPKTSSLRKEGSLKLTDLDDQNDLP